MYNLFVKFLLFNVMHLIAYLLFCFVVYYFIYSQVLIYLFVI